MKIQLTNNPNRKWYKPWTWNKVYEVDFENDFIISKKIDIKAGIFNAADSYISFPITLKQRRQTLEFVKKYLKLK